MRSPAGVLLLNIGLLGWRLASIGEAGLTPIPTRPRTPATVAVVVLLMIITVAMHTWLATATLAADQALARIFDPRVGSSYEPPSIGSHPDPVDPTYGWDGTERVNILLLGYDSGPGRVDENTDTLLVVSIDPVSRTAALISIPRDTGYVPLPDGRIYSDGLTPPREQPASAATTIRPVVP
jgi:hypothetical protein